MSKVQHLSEHGWCMFEQDPRLLSWLKHATPAALATAQDPALRAQWLRHGGTWFAGVNVLRNDETGAVAGSGPLAGDAITFVEAQFGPQVWDQAQISVVYPGYPRQDTGESDAAHGYRKRRDAAHVDGLLPVGPDRRRHLHEPHGFVLGLPMTRTGEGASPLTVWNGSHKKMQAAFRQRLAKVAPGDWADEDLTETYHVARRDCFATCDRIELPAQPGEAYLVHRLALHGVAAWKDNAKAPASGRVVAYFRPELQQIEDWLA